jgi:hypothetical protein
MAVQGPIIALEGVAIWTRQAIGKASPTEQGAIVLIGETGGAMSYR